MYCKCQLAVGYDRDNPVLIVSQPQALLNTTNEYAIIIHMWRVMKHRNSFIICFMVTELFYIWALF
jgi:hypothetical protein